MHILHLVHQEHLDQIKNTFCAWINVLFWTVFERWKKLLANQSPDALRRLAFSIGAVSLVSFSGCQPIRLPSIDPTGARVFAPGSTTVVGPFQSNNAPLINRNPVPNTGLGIPAYQAPPNPPPCNLGKGCLTGHKKFGPTLGERIHQSDHVFNRAKKGELILTPSRAIAPVGSEVILLSGICGGNRRYVLNQPLEWMLSNDSVGQFVEVGGTDHGLTNPIIPPSAKKIDGDYAWGRTLLKPRHITRGTPTPVDDLYVKKGQAWISVSSASEGTSYITCVAPKAEAWDKRKRVTVIHWIDATWSIPAPTVVGAGQVAPLDVAVKRSTDGSGVANYKVRYEIVGGVPAEFVPSGASKVEVLTNENGNAPIQIRQVAGQSNAGPTHIKVDIIRPAMYGQREMLVESGLTTVTWSAPALGIRVLGPSNAAVDQTVSYRLEITNTGDQLARAVTVRTNKLSPEVQLISAEPKPTIFGNQFQWELGDIQPNSQPRYIDLNWKMPSAGTAQLCFELASATDGLRTEACANTRIAAPCLGLAISGPQEASQGQTIHYDFQIVNQCDQPLEEVNVQVAYDNGLRLPGRSNKIEYAVGEPIQPGETRTIGLDFIADQAGVSCFSLDIIAKGGHTAQARRCVTINQSVQPAIDLKINRITAAQVGQKILTRYQVSNTGSTTLENVTLITQFSNSIVPDTASEEFQPRWIGDDLAFSLGNLGPGQQKTVEVISICERVDANAFVKASVTTPANINDLDEYSFPISDAVNGGIESPPSIPGNGADPNTGQPGNGVRIPADPNNQGLRVNVNSTVQQATVNNNVEFMVDISNLRTGADQNLKIVLQIPPELEYQDLDDSQSNLPVAGISQDRKTVTLQTRQLVRGEETISFRVLLKALQPGTPALTVSAVSQNEPNGIQRAHRITVRP